MATANPTADSKVEKLRLAHLNIRSLRNKVHEVNHILTCDKIHVLALTETHLDNSVENSELNIESYRLYRKDRQSRGGGVALYIQNQIPVKELPDLDESDLEMIWVEIYLPRTKPGLVGCCYRPTSTNMKYLDKIFKKTEMVSGEDKDTFLLGDFNIDWFKNKFRFSVRGLTQIVNVPTRVGKSCSSCIDHIYTNIPELCSEPTSADTDCSDHKLITVTIQRSVLKAEDTVIQRSNRTFDRDKFISDIEKGSWGDVQDESEPEEALSKFTAMFKSIADEHTPLMRYTTNKRSTPWWGDDITGLILERDDAKKTAFESDSQEEMDDNSERQKKRYLLLKKEISEKIKHRRKKYFQQKLRAVNNDRKKIEELLEEFNQKTLNTPLIHTESEKLNGPTETDILNVFNQFYADKFEQFKSQCLHHEDLPLSHFLIEFQIMKNRLCSLRFRTVDDKAVERLLLSLRVPVTPGTDEIDAFLLKTAAPYISAPIRHILNTCIDRGEFPSQWKESKIIPDCTNTDFRPQTVLPVLSQILEKVLVQQMEEYFNENELFIHHHTLDDMTHHWLTGLTDNKQVGAVFMDFTTSSNIISPDLLVAKLKSYSFSDSALSMMRSFLSDRKQKVFYNGCTSQWRQTDCGLPRGSCLAHFLFSVYTQDLKLFLKASSIVMCDSYLIIYHSADNRKDLKKVLTDESLEVCEWIKDNMMVLNKSTQIITTTKRFSDTRELLRSIADILQDRPLSWSEHFY